MDDGKNVVLIGFSGTGKSSAGLILAKRARMRFLDTDIEIEKRYNLSVAGIFSLYGERFFRLAEAEVTAGLPRTGCVVAAGGGIVVNEAAMAPLKNGTVIYLRADAHTINARLKNDATRPLLNTGDKLKTAAGLIQKRAPLYERYADIIIDAAELDIMGTVYEIEKRWGSL